MSKFTFPLLKGVRFIIKKRKIIHLESGCCRGHDEKCPCHFCSLHRPYMESSAYQLIKMNDTNAQEVTEE